MALFDQGKEKRGERGKKERERDKEDSLSPQDEKAVKQEEK